MNLIFMLTNSTSMQCRNNNDNDHNNSGDQRSQYIIFCIEHEGVLSLQIYPPFQKQRTFFMIRIINDSQQTLLCFRKTIQ